jgi:hypothetical protein
MKIDWQMQRQHECQQRNDQRKNPNVPVAPGKNYQEQSSRQRKERY